MNILEVKNITKIYKIYDSNLHRLKDVFFKTKNYNLLYANKSVSFNLKKGETLGIIGLNGAGKSTLLKIISGVIPPSEGEITAMGKIISLLELGTGFNFEMSGRENIFLNGLLIGMSKDEIESRIKEIIEFSELGNAIDKPLKTYSSGMVVRLAFSISIFADPDIFIVDEALSVGDAHFQQKCTRILKERKSSDMSIIYVSHDLNSLKLLCDRLILLDKGEKIKEGSPEEVINYYNFLLAKLDGNSSKIEKKDNFFGNFDVEITDVKILGKESKSNIISAGEEGSIILKIKANKDIPNLTVGILIRDRFGQDIFGTNTFYHNKNISLKKDEVIEMNFDLKFNLGVGKYTLTVAIHDTETHVNNCYHWVDFAGDFEIAGVKGAIFNGICRLEPQIKIIR